MTVRLHASRSDVERALEAGALAIEAVDDDEPRQAELLGRRPHLLGLHHHAGDRVDDDQRGVGDAAARRARRRRSCPCRACRSG